MDVQNGYQTDGTPIWVYTSNNTVAQKWRVEYAGGGTFRLVSLLNGTSVLTVSGGSASDGSPLVISASTGAASQTFTFNQKSDSTKIMLDGIDVSSWQPSNIGYLVDYDFMIVKASQGTWYTNPNLQDQAWSALNRNKKLGLYHYAEAGTDPKAEAQFFVSQCGPFIGRAVLMLDYESDALNNGRAWVQSFIEEVRRLTGVSCGVYCSASPAAAQQIPQLCASEGVLFWNANYRLGYTVISGYRQDIAPDLSCDIYQYTSTGWLSGYSGNLDFDLYYGSAADWDYWCVH